VNGGAVGARIGTTPDTQAYWQYLWALCMPASTRYVALAPVVVLQVQGHSRGSVTSTEDLPILRGLLGRKVMYKMDADRRMQGNSVAAAGMGEYISTKPRAGAHQQSLQGNPLRYSHCCREGKEAVPLAVNGSLWSDLKHPSAAP
jgi:hypothetical protein